MYKWVIIILLSWINLSWATNHYVDKNASGQNNGTSWDNAWQSFSAINLSSLNPGDIVYFSGGTDSTVYYEELVILNLHGTATNWITFRNSYDTGHNGRVILDGNNYTLNNGITLGSDGSNTNSYIYLKGFEIRNYSSSGYAGITIRYPNNCITIDSCMIYNNRHYGINLFGTSPAGRSDYTQCTDSVTIKNSYIANGQEDAFSNETDLIKADAVTNTVIDNNVFHLKRPVYSNSNHCDGIQALGTSGWTITNNFFIDDSACYSQANILSFYDYIADGHMDSVIYYNNVFYEGGTWSSPGGTGEGTAFFMKREFAPPAGTQPSPLVAINNTIVTYGPNYSAVEMMYERDASYFKNNIIAQFGNGNNGEQDKNYLSMFVHNAAPDTIFLDDWNKNLWYKEWGTEDWDGGSGDYWKGNGYTGSGDINGVDELNSLYGLDNLDGDPDFQHDFSYGNHLQASIDAYTRDDFRNGDRPQFWMPQSNSPAIDAGENLQSVVEGMGLPWTDINGNARDNTPTIGAYESVSRGPDITPPEVTGAVLLDSVTLKILFSEVLEQSSAEDENNYSISNNIDIFNASLSGSAVTLQTTVHSPGSYIVTVVNVKDLAGNPIAQSNTAEYSLIPPDSLIMFTVENVEGVIQEPEHTPLKTIDGLGALDGDPDSRWAAEPMPEELTFDLGSIRIVCKTKLSFYRWNFGRVYTYSILISSDNNNWVTIVSQAISALQEEWTIDEFPAVDARYVKILFINNNESGWAGLWEGEIWGIITSVADPVNNGLPNDFALHQNYPNPFNPITTIKYEIPEVSFVTIKVYGALGNEIIRLVNAEKPEGSYDVNFDATGLPSGIYFYRLQAGSFLETKKMVLMK